MCGRPQNVSSKGRRWAYGRCVGTTTQSNVMFLASTGPDCTSQTLCLLKLQQRGGESLFGGRLKSLEGQNALETSLGCLMKKYGLQPFWVSYRQCGRTEPWRTEWFLLVCLEQTNVVNSVKPLTRILISRNSRGAIIIFAKLVVHSTLFPEAAPLHRVR